MPAVQLYDVTRAFETGAGHVVALRAFNLSISEGELLVVMGVSGSGKSTLINILAGLLPPSEGTILSFGVELHSCSSEERARYRREISSVVFQEYNLLSMLNAEENVTLSLEIAGVPRVQARERAGETLRRVDLGAFAKRYPGQLSGGQRQRVAIARALAGRRPLVLADEPTGSLDDQTSEGIRTLLRDLADAGSTVVVATHDPAFRAIADRVLHLADGQETGLPDHGASVSAP